MCPSFRGCGRRRRRCRARRLRTTGAPLHSVAARVGYASEYAFAHAFKREFGTPPGRCRREERRAPQPA
ncbi:helix-turn-helix domain-containing protein [Streptomyces filamentosus]